MVEYLQERRHVDSAGSSCVFVNRSARGLTTQGASNVIRDLARRSRVERHVTPHMIRHTVATLLACTGTNTMVIQKCLGHQSVSTTEIYMHLSTASLINEMFVRHPSIVLLGRDSV